MWDARTWKSGVDGTSTEPLSISLHSFMALPHSNISVKISGGRELMCLERRVGIFFGHVDVACRDKLSRLYWSSNSLNSSSKAYGLQ